MRITAIEELSQSRSKIHIDGEFAFVLYKGELRQYGLREGQEISDRDYEIILTEVLPRRAKLRAMNLLKSREYTEQQLYRKLKDGLYPEEVIREALEYVASYHYTDDLRYAVSYIEAHESSRSRRRIEQDLLGKGIPGAILEQAWNEWEARGGRMDEAAMVHSLLRKRGVDPEQADANTLRKTYAFLQRKGFSFETIRKAMKGFGETDFGGDCE